MDIGRRSFSTGRYNNSLTLKNITCICSISLSGVLFEALCARPKSPTVLSGML
jgi:hypothetical protein